MGKVSTYLNFDGRTEEAFTFYASLFGATVGELTRFGGYPGMPPMSEDDQNKVLHVEMTIFDGHRLMATDMLASLGQQTRVGNNTTISLELDSPAEADRLYDALSQGGDEGSGMSQMPFGYWGSCLDRFGVRWMFNVAP